MTNPRTVEFERKIQNMLIRATTQTIKEAEENNKSPYDVDIEKESFVEFNQTYNNDATPEPTKRAYKNLVNREVFVEDVKERMQIFRLNPERAEQDIMIDKDEGIYVTMPELKKKEGEQA
jgi:hypothetical protein